MDKLLKWFGELSLLILCAAVLWLSPAMGASDTQEGVKSTIQAPAGAVQKKPVTPQRLKIVSLYAGSILSRNVFTSLLIIVEVKNTSKEQQVFYLRPELPGIPRSVQPSGRLTIGPLETRNFELVLERINPGDQSGNFTGVVRLLNQSAQKELDSGEFSYRVVDRRPAEDLKVDAVKITRVTMVTRNVIDSVKYKLFFSNAGREIFGNPIRLFTELRTGNVDGTMRVLRDTRGERNVQSGLQPGQKRELSGQIFWPRGSRNAGLWYTLVVTLSADSDDADYNNHIQYSFIIDSGGKVIASKVERPTM